ncbi:MAG TPA: hypothetical protein VFU47_17050 [Armatimonadota bacterium]|nr:hypothetical protein [Armatimonadota bacterium]
MTRAAGYPCSNHPQVLTDRICTGCGRPFCPACLTEIGGKATCGWCRDLCLAQLQTRKTVNPQTVVFWARIFNGVTLLAATGFTALLGTIFSLPLWLPSRSPSPTASTTTEFSVILGVLGVVLVATWLVLLPPALFLGPGRPWTWAWQLVAIVVAGVGSLVLMSSLGLFVIGAAAALGIFWLRPEVRAYCDGQA